MISTEKSVNFSGSCAERSRADGDFILGWREDQTSYRRLARVGVLVLGCAVLAGCASQSKLTSRIDPKYGVAASPRVVEPGQPVPKGGGVYRVGKPYVVAGRTFVPEDDTRYRAEGLASWYGDDFHGRLTANGEVFDMESISAAHPTLPMPSYVRITNLSNRKSIIARVNDRGPYHGNRVIDLSKRTAELLGFHGHGVARVRVEYVGGAPLEGSDDRRLMATLREGVPAPAPSTVMVASARPFVPGIASRSPIMRDAPLPSERPYDLGEERASPQPVLSPYRTAHRAAPVSEVTAVRAYEPIAAAPLPAPVSAYAPIRHDGSRAVATGRGLY
jgi:peptidoglycan lytic transglycosylase